LLSCENEYFECISGIDGADIMCCDSPPDITARRLVKYFS